MLREIPHDSSHVRSDLTARRMDDHRRKGSGAGGLRPFQMHLQRSARDILGPGREADGILVRINQVVIETSAQLHHQRGKERSDPIATRFNEGLVLLVASG